MVNILRQIVEAHLEVVLVLGESNDDGIVYLLATQVLASEKLDIIASVPLHLFLKMQLRSIITGQQSHRFRCILLLGAFST